MGKKQVVILYWETRTGVWAVIVSTHSSLEIDDFYLLGIEFFELGQLISTGGEPWHQVDVAWNRALSQLQRAPSCLRVWCTAGTILDHLHERHLAEEFGSRQLVNGVLLDMSSYCSRFD